MHSIYAYSMCMQYVQYVTGCILVDMHVTTYITVFCYIVLYSI